MTESDERRSLELPANVVGRVERRLPRTEFDSPEAYATYVLEEVLSHVESEANGDFEAVDETEVKNRLRSLGYLNE